MSRELYFYRVKKIDEALPEVIDIDETPIDYAYTKVFGSTAKSIQYMYRGE